MTPEPKPGLMRISPYVGGKSNVAGANRVVKLSSNENPHGASPKAVEAFRAAGDTLALYPDGGAVALRQAIAKTEGLDADQIMIGSGSDEILSLLCLAYAGPGDEVLHSAHGFLMYAISAKAVGADPVAAPEKDLHADVDALLEAATEKTKIVFLANPNNPTGTILPGSEIRRLRDGLPEGVLLVIDAAYAEYVERDDYDPGTALVDERDDVIMTRTFSKIHGLAALRLGWCYGPPAIIDALHRARGPFNTSAPAQAAGTAAIQDQPFVKATRDDNTHQRARVADALTMLGLTVTPSEGNFVLVEAGAHGPRSAKMTDEFLQTRGILVRRMEGYGLPGHLRISIGTAEENGLLIDAMRDLHA
jgi:histidinol-phosphate aminotransferase